MTEGGQLHTDIISMKTSNLANVPFALYYASDIEQ